MRSLLGSGSGKVFRPLLTVAGVIAMCVATSVSGESPSPPISHRQAAERVIATAMDDLGIPEGNGMTACIVVDGAAPGGDILEIAAAEFLLEHGYKIAGSDTFPEFRVGLDTLAVSLESEGGFWKKKVRRRAEARVKAVFREARDARKVFVGQGIYEDVFSKGALGKSDRDDPFIIDRSRSFTVVRPIFFGLTVTGLIWLLYSYRG